MGGIPTDVNGRVFKDEKGAIVEGLYAAGECACVSVHGANRLGCNSLLDTVVFGRRAGMAIGRYIKEADKREIAKDPVDKVKGDIDALVNSKGVEQAGALRSEFQKMMMDKCSVFRNEEGLNGLVRDLNTIKERAKSISIKDKGTKFNTELLEALELNHLINLGEAIAFSALQRKESRGAHSREDFPKRDDENWLKHTFAFKAGSGIEFRHKPVTITRFKPEERKY
jgi:succinate dehydrogenase / fumarate reductase flavoprotein subunit